MDDCFLRYAAKMAQRPLLTSSITTGVRRDAAIETRICLLTLLFCLQTLFGAGDVLAQQVVDKKGFDKHDYARTGRMVLYGGGSFSSS